MICPFRAAHSAHISFILLLIWSGIASSVTAQSISAAPRIEAGLEEAVNWKWWVTPGPETEWALTIDQPATEVRRADPNLPAPPAQPQARPDKYEVKRGDALARIARAYGMTTEQLKAANGLTKDTIQVGQVLKIPTALEIAMMAPPPPPPKPADEPAPAPAPAEEPKKKKKGQDTTAQPSRPRPILTPLTSEADAEKSYVLQQVFLDREGFSPGSIDGTGGPTLSKMRELYLSVHTDLADVDALKARAQAAVEQPFTTYRLRAEDFRFILPSHPSGSAKKRGSKAGAPGPTYEQLVAAPTLAYRSAWEFAAERFHCYEPFLRKHNSKLPTNPGVGAEFVVPNVYPFEIERAFEGDLQPKPDQITPVTAVLAELSRLEISRAGRLIAVMPIGLARPDLRGRGAWTILDAIPRPRMATLQDEKEKAQRPTSAYAPTVSTPDVPVKPPRAVLTSEQYLPAGPNNPVGVIWINLAKSGSTEPLPYGLHGTSIPERMRTLEGIGGIRLANWDIARAARLLPVGTPLQWK